MHPILYEINTRCWLRELSARRKKPVHLGTIPDSELDRWQRFGFTHLWLMGVWSTCSRAREFALSDASLLAAYSKVIPDWTAADVPGSPYSISDYLVPAELGGEEGLRQFRRRLNDRGLKLILDFVPNHTGLAHPWVRNKPGLFVPGRPGAPGIYAVESAAGVAWIAHGKDPHFPCWSDSAQLDYRNPETHALMREVLEGIAARCDGVRCDMAMLILNEVFSKTWAGHPASGFRAVPEFWEGAIAAVKRAHPGFLFVAEVYWDLERHLQRLGFDFTYDKWLYDHLAYDNAGETQYHLLEVEPEFLRRGVHFIEDHDEQRAATRFLLDEHRVAALLTMGLPGMRFLHEGQLTGARMRLPVQLSRRPAEPVDPAIADFYEQLLAILPKTAVGRGDWEILRPRSAWSDDESDHHFVVVQWHDAAGSFDLVVVNLSNQPSQCFVTPTVPNLARREWAMHDLLGIEKYSRSGLEMRSKGLYLALPPRGAQLFHFSPAA